MSRVSARGLTALDQRSAGARALLEWRQELEGDLGGTEALSIQQRTLVELACRLRLYLDHVDGWLMDQPSLILKRKRILLPVVRERMALSDSLVRVLKDLGLKRQPKDLGNLEDYLKEQDHEHSGSHERSEVVPEDVPAEEGSVPERPGDR
jgi:hypothetical protein